MAKFFFHSATFLLGRRQHFRSAVTKHPQFPAYPSITPTPPCLAGRVCTPRLRSGWSIIMVDSRLRDHSELAESLPNTEELTGVSYHVCHPFFPNFHPNVYHAQSGVEGGGGRRSLYSTSLTEVSRMKYGCLRGRQARTKLLPRPQEHARQSPTPTGLTLIKQMLGISCRIGSALLVLVKFVANLGTVTGLSSTVGTLIGNSR